MNLPPVPGNRTAPSSADAPSVPLPPAPIAAAQSGSAKGLRARVIVSCAVLAVGLLIAAYSLVTPQPPSEPALKNFVLKQVSGQGVKVQDVWVGSRESDNLGITFQVRVESSRGQDGRYGNLFGEPRYPGETPSLPDWLKLDQGDWLRCEKAVAGPFGARLCQLAGLDPNDEVLLHIKLLRTLQPEGEFHFTTSGTVTALRQGRGWQLAWNPATENGQAQAQAQGPGAGKPLSAFGGPVCVVDRPADKERLLELAERIPAIRGHIEKAIPALIAENKTTLLGQLKPGAFFSGTATGSQDNKALRTRVFLDVTEVRSEEDGMHLTALLRNDGSWADVRMFTGTVVFGEEGMFALVLSPEANDGSTDLAGPFLTDRANGFELTDRNGTTTLSLTIDGSALTWNTPGNTLRLEAGTAEDRAKIMAELAAEVTRSAAAVQPNRVYAGTITDRITGNIEKCVLRFVAYDAGTQKVTATLEKSLSSSPALALSGKLETNRYREGAGSIAFDPADQPVPEAWQAFWEQISPLVLHIDGNKLQDQKPKCILRFELAGAAATSAP